MGERGKPKTQEWTKRCEQTVHRKRNDPET